jgi:hypothetical protein
MAASGWKYQISWKWENGILAVRGRYQMADLQLPTINGIMGSHTAR